MERAKLLIETCMLLHNFGLDDSSTLVEPPIGTTETAGTGETDSSAAGDAKRSAIANSLL